MKTYEYMWSRDLSIENLNKLGKEGWEVCIYGKLSFLEFEAFLLKREII